MNSNLNAGDLASGRGDIGAAEAAPMWKKEEVLLHLSYQ
jgi:hypothetical protein